MVGNTRGKTSQGEIREGKTGEYRIRMEKKGGGTTGGGKTRKDQTEEATRGDTRRHERQGP